MQLRGASRMRSAKRGMSALGRLSTQNQPLSSRARGHVRLPGPAEAGDDEDARLAAAVTAEARLRAAAAPGAARGGRRRAPRRAVLTATSGARRRPAPAVRGRMPEVVLASIISSTRSTNWRAASYPRSLRSWLRAATSTRMARFRPGATGMRMSGISDSRIEELLVLEAEPIVLPSRLPALQADHQLDPLRGADGGDAVEVLDVDDPQAAQLHVVAREVGRGAR